MKHRLILLSISIATLIFLINCSSDSTLNTPQTIDELVPVVKETANNLTSYSFTLEATASRMIERDKEQINIFTSQSMEASLDLENRLSQFEGVFKETASTNGEMIEENNTESAMYVVRLQQKWDKWPR